ncbi:MAG: aminopeptidase P N-terminal domain-containing protein [Gammaproteobacteria bacterium]|nr:aminopeptidase P N-terminal domain-containing protein [Gammaproteobacteria bacterium]
MEQDACKERRAGLMALIGDAVAIIPTAPVRNRNNDVDFLFRPASDFYYLTRFPEPEAVAVLAPGRPQGEYLLFCRDKNPEREQWEGRRAGQENAVAEYGADEAFSIDDIDDILPGLLENRSRVYYSIGRHPEFDGHVVDWLNEVRQKSRAGVQAPTAIVDVDSILHDMRLRKRPEEVAIMRRAGQLGAKAHVRAMQTCRPGLFEYELEAELLYTFRKGGASYVAYPPIVAGGANACILHYTENNAPLRDGSLVLIDAGCEIDCYASDITRTFPVGRRFTPEQRALYDIVLAAHGAALAEIGPGRAWPAAHDAAVRVLTQGLRDTGLLKGTTDELIESGAYRRFYMHRTGHWLGMDVHDVGAYRTGDGPRILEAGMVTTVEPGLYIRAADDVPAAFHDIGIRIEDDVLVTGTGCEILSEGVPRSAAAIEELRAEAF